MECTYTPVADANNPVVLAAALLQPSFPGLTPEHLIASLKSDGCLDDPVFTRTEAVKWSTLSLSTLDRFIKSEELEVIRIGRAVRIRKSSLEAFLRKRMSTSES